MGIFLSIVAGICVALLFSLAIFIHEFGHFLAARILGLQVDAFSIGFGPALFKRTVNGIVYKIGCIPFGGYVALPQLDPSGMEKVQGNTPEAEEGHRQLADVVAWKRIIVALAGPFGNIVLAVILAYLIFIMPGVKTGVISTRIGSVVESSAAWQAGLRPGDQILTVNDTKVSTWSDLQVENQLAGEQGHAIFVIQRGHDRQTFKMTFETNNIFGLRVLAGVYPEEQCEIAEVITGSSAEEKGLQSKDVVLAIDKVPVMGLGHFATLIAKVGDAETELTIQRANELLRVVVRPRFDETLQRPMIGIRWKDGSERVKAWMMYRDPWQQLKWDAMSVVRVLKALILPKSKGELRAVAKNVGGPIAIVMGLYDTVRGNFMDGLGFLRMICINLAILNLLPLPVLDGGHIIFAMFEVCTRRKPHPKVVSVLVNACAILLIGLMILLVYGDVMKRFKLNKVLHALEQTETVKKP